MTLLSIQIPVPRDRSASKWKIMLRRMTHSSTAAHARLCRNEGNKYIFNSVDLDQQQIFQVQVLYLPITDNPVQTTQLLDKRKCSAEFQVRITL